MNRYIAELVGTFALALAVGISLSGKFPIPTPFVAALALGICVYTFGAISGTHINPAITLGLLVNKKIGVQDAVSYIIAQIAGASLAMGVATSLLGQRPNAGGADSLAIAGAEMLGTFFLAIGVISVVSGKAPESASGVVIGGSLLLGITMAAPASNAVLNPAVALSIGSFSVTYMLAPIAGSVLAMLAYQFLITEKKAGESSSAK